MAQEQVNSFSSILSINPYKETYYRSVSNFLTIENDPKYAKDQLVTSYINTKEFINAQIEISKNIPDEDLFDALTNKIYDELALDQAIDYKMQYVEIFDYIDEENRHFHVFIVDPVTIENTFENVIRTIKYIDFVTPVPLLLRTLYKKELVPVSGIHCYIYLQENDAFLTVYSEGEYIYTKALKFSFVDIHEKFCELYGEQIEFEEFINFFTHVNLKETQSDYKSYIIKLYKELFSNINDILTYVKRAFEFDKIDQVYIGSQIQMHTQLHQMLEAELNVPAKNFSFDYGFENNEEYIDQLHALLHLYLNLPAKEQYRCNFTQFERPPKFTKRASGKLILVTAAAFVLAFAYPITYWTLTYAQSLQYEILQQNYSELHATKMLRQATIKSKELEKSKVHKLLTIEELEYKQKKDTLVKIHDVKVNYPMKADLIALFTKELKKFNVKTTKMFYSQEENNKTLTLQLVSNQDRKITLLIEHLTKVYEGKYTFKLEEIALNMDSNLYMSELKVRLP